MVTKWHIVDDCEQFIAKCPACGCIADSRNLPSVCPKCGQDFNEKRTDFPRPLTVTMELLSTDVMILEEIVGEKVETVEQAIGALRVAMVYGALEKKNHNGSAPCDSNQNK